MEHVVNVGLRMLSSIPMAISAPAGTILNAFLACSRFWIILYGLILIIHDIFFTIFPTTLIVISVLTLVLHYSRIEPPPQQFVDAVFGYNPSISYPVVGSKSMRDLAASIIGIGNIPLQTALNSLHLSGIPLQTTLNSLNLDQRLTNMATQILFGSPSPDTNIVSDRPRQTRTNQTTFTTPMVSTSVSDQDLSTMNLGLKHARANPIVPIVAHRGAGTDAPENSLIAFVRCKEHGCTFVHFDLKLSRDSVPLCFHDDDLYRITGIAKKFHAFSSNELRNIEISLKHPLGQSYRGTRMPTLDEAVETCIRLNLKFFINILDTNQRIVNLVCGTYKKYQAMYVMAVVTSFHFKVVHDIRRRDNKIIGCVQLPYDHRLDARQLDPRAHSFFLMNFFQQWWEIFHDWVIEHFFWWFLGISALIMEKDCVSKKQVLEWSNKGIRVFLCPVNHPLEKLYLNQIMSVGYFTDTLEDFNHRNDQLSSMSSIPPSQHPSDESLEQHPNTKIVQFYGQNDSKVQKRGRQVLINSKLDYSS